MSSPMRMRTFGHDVLILMAVMMLPKTVYGQYRADANAILNGRKQDSVAKRNRSVWCRSAILRISKGPMAW